MILNDHCQVCEFRQRCHEQAVREDSISLLRGISENEVKHFARKGLFTVTQLAHTFRPRRKGTRKGPGSQKHHHALQAMAVRDKTIYVFGTPELPAKPVRIYVDMEGDPDENYVYLIGMIVVRDGTETRHSFWADSKEQETQIFEAFLAEVAKYEDASVFCYGAYERAFLKRMRKQAKRKACGGPGAQRPVQHPVRDLQPRLFPHLLERTQRHRSLPGVLVVGTGRLWHPEHRVAKAVGGYGQR